MIAAGRARPSDARFMRRALALAARGLGRTYPNPPVGAVLVRGGRVVGEGFHARAGGPHAEIEAIRAAGSRARGAELFVTLEPCTVHGRTPPCLDAVLGLDLARVVIGAVDPDPRVRGRGIRGLRRRGVPVVVGVEGAAAGDLVAGFRSRVLRGRPLVTPQAGGHAERPHRGAWRRRALDHGRRGAPARTRAAQRVGCRPRRSGHGPCRRSAAHVPRAWRA